MCHFLLCHWVCHSTDSDVTLSWYLLKVELHRHILIHIIFYGPTPYATLETQFSWAYCRKCRQIEALCRCPRIDHRENHNSNTQIKKKRITWASVQLSLLCTPLVQVCGFTQSSVPTEYSKSIKVTPVGRAYLTPAVVSAFCPPLLVHDGWGTTEAKDLI